MKGLADETLYKIIHDYFLLYLPRMRKCSDHTIRSYREVISSLLEFIAKSKNISLSAITFKMITSDMIADFLDSLENQGVCISTRNQRLQAIRSFFGYAVMVDPALMIYRNEIYKVPVKKNTNKETIEYLSEKAVRVLLEQPDRTTEKGMRDIFILLLMYDSAARVQELVDIKICDLVNGKTPLVILHGKGSKVRTVPLMESTMVYFEKYFKIYHPGETYCSNQYLFYSVRNGEKNPLDTSTIRKMISKYGRTARELCSSIPENVHPHLLRHSRAMHLYQHGMELSLISQWLGHSQYETTLIYAHADTEQKRKAIEQATSKNNVLKKSDTSKRYVISDDEMLKRLYGLKAT